MSDPSNLNVPLVRCKRPECLIYCEHGQKMDRHGCPTCECLKAPSSGSKKPAPGTSKTGTPEENWKKPDCSRRPMCAMYCADGFKTGSDGCPVCECNPSGGKGGRRDLKPNQPESCGDKPMCRMFCELGFQTGKDGCDVCACLSDPCLVSTLLFYHLMAHHLQYTLCYFFTLIC